MAQPQPAPMITPTVTIKIQHQVPDKDPVEINVGEEVEIHNEDNVPYEIPISYVDGSNDDDFPLALYLPAGGKIYFIGTSASTCNYDVDNSSRLTGSGEHTQDTGPYTIIVSSTDDSKGRK